MRIIRELRGLMGDDDDVMVVLLRLRDEVAGHVWCDVHGCVHEPTRDPYQTGAPECSEDHWRILWMEEDE